MLNGLPNFFIEDKASMMRLHKNIETVISALKADNQDDVYKGHINKMTFASQICAMIRHLIDTGGENVTKKEADVVHASALAVVPTPALPATSSGPTNATMLNYSQLPQTRAELDDLLASDDFDFDFELERAKQHPKFNDFMQAEFSPETDYIFGDPENDPGQDLADFIEWLRDKSGEGEVFACILGGRHN